MHRAFSILFFVAVSYSPTLVSATKTPDLVTCSTFTNTDTVELTSWYAYRPEYARFGLLLCNIRGKDPVPLTFSSRGALTIAFFDVPVPTALSVAQPIHSSRTFARALGLAEKRKWRDVIDELREQGKLSAVVQRTVTYDKSLWIGYVAIMQAAHPVKTESEIVYVADMAEAEDLISVNLEHVERGFNSFLDALPMFATNLLGVFVGAILSFIFFRQQQGVLAGHEEVKLFRQRKLERADALVSFFHDVYPDFRTNSERKEEAQKLRKALVKHGVYSMLPLATMDELNRLCDNDMPNQTRSRLRAFFYRIRTGKKPPRQSRGQMLDNLLKSNFPELMV